MQYLLPAILMSAIMHLSSPVFGGENCSQLGGSCQNACRQSERPEYGAFEDCGESQECCVAHDASRDQIKCCISSFEAQHYGPPNCFLPQENTCPQGSGSPESCESLAFCEDKK